MMIPVHLLARITGERRRRLVEYLLRWGEPAAALHALDCWLAAQPHLVTLREARARVQLELGIPESTLALLDELDGERGMSASRRDLRLRALAALGRWDDAYVLLQQPLESVGDWRLYAELLLRQGRFDEAANAYHRAVELMPAGSAPLRGLAELALAQGDLSGAWAIIVQRQQQFADMPPDPRDLRLLQTIAERQRNTGALVALTAQINQCRMTEETTLMEVLGIDLDEFNRTDHGTSADGTFAPAPENRPAPTRGADEPALPQEVWKALREHFGYETFRPGQANAIAAVLRGETTLAVLPTGAGKSLTYQLPALLLPGATLVISPLIALMKDQIDNLPPALARRATMINSSLEPGETAKRLREIAAGRYKLIYIAPERLRQQPFVHALKHAGVARVVVDEVHCVSLWGISFRPDYLFIRRALDELGAPPLLALTATATPDTAAEIKTHLGELTTIRTSIFRPNLRLEVSHVSNKSAKLAAVIAHCQAIAGPIVVYVRSRDGCEEVAQYLRRNDIAAEHYHAMVADRAGVQDRFMRGQTRVLVATVAFGMGVDKPDIRGIIHYNLPQSVEAYYQEAGRAGRDGSPARCILLYTPSDKGQLTAWLRGEGMSKDYLRGVYRWLRQRIQGAWGVIAVDDLRRDLREGDEARMRVALGLLERVGLLTRHFDLPRAATLILRDDAAGDPAFHAFLQAARMRLGQPLDVDLIDVAQRYGSAPDQFERQLLRWQDQGLLRYDGVARDVLLELHPTTNDIGNSIDRLLAEYATRQNARVEAIATYARGLTCRHRMIAAHFGEQQSRCRNACDICQPNDERDHAPGALGHHRPSAIAAKRAGMPDVPPINVAEQAILDAVHELPAQLSDKQIALTLLGQPGYPACAPFGRLAGGDFMTVRQNIGRLIAAGKLAYRNGTLIISASASATSPAMIEPIVLRCLAHLPFPVGKSGLTKILKGAAGSPIGPERCAEFAMLSHLTGAAIGQAIEQMIERNLLRRSSGSRPLLSLTQRGAVALAQNVVQ